MERENFKEVLIRPLVLKNRNGPIGTCFDLKWWKATNQYYNLGWAHNWQTSIRERRAKSKDNSRQYVSGELEE
jgi:hypothetical protein